MTGTATESEVVVDVNLSDEVACDIAEDPCPNAAEWVAVTPCCKTQFPACATHKARFEKHSLTIAAINPTLVHPIVCTTCRVPFVPPRWVAL